MRTEFFVSFQMSFMR